MRRKIPPVLLSLLVLIAASPYISGCGSSSSDSTAAGSAQATLATDSTKTQGATIGSNQEVTVPEPPAPAETGSAAPQSVGQIVDGLQLSDIRWADHGTYFRIVFEIANPAGDLAQVPRADATMSADHKQVNVVLSGIRSLGSGANVTAKSLNVGDSVVKTVTRVPSGDDQAMIYEIDLSKATVYSLSGLASPGRIIVDITK